jgi:molecular chaperone GrpE
MANETEVEEPSETPSSAPQEPPVVPRQAEHEEVLETTDMTETSETDTGGVDAMVDEGAPAESSEVQEELKAASMDAAQLEQALAERTADLQRLQAEYVNYKRRVDRDRELVRENASYTALAPIVEVLDTIDRARESARSLGTELEEGLRAVAEQLERVVTNAGLVKYGEPGDAFDPQFHEALSHIGEDPEVEVTTCKVVAKAGYRIGERVVRAAQVLVVDPASS